MVPVLSLNISQHLPSHTYPAKRSNQTTSKHGQKRHKTNPIHLKRDTPTSKVFQTMEITMKYKKGHFMKLIRQLKPT